MSTQPAGPGQTAPTGSGGATGTTGQPANPAKPGPQGVPGNLGGHVKPRTWDGAPAQSRLQAGYAAFRTAYRDQLPSTKQQLGYLAHRPLGGR